MSDTGDNEQWYWDLGRGIAVRASDRGPFTEMMGPYSSKAEAERWQERVDERNTAWDDDDEEWESRGESPDDDTSSGPAGSTDVDADDLGFTS